MAATVKLVFWLLVVPFLSGMPLTSVLPREKQTPAVVFIAGFLVHLTLFELVSVPCMLAELWFPFRRVVVIFTLLSLLWAAFGVFAAFRRKKEYGVLFERPEKPDTETLVYWGIFLALLLVQLAGVLLFTSFDGDDAYYVTQSVITAQTDRMYTLLPYTGFSTRIDVRHALAAVPMWQAYLARMSGLHAAVIAHVAVPLVWIPFTYLISGAAGACLFKNNKKQLPVFLILFSLFRIFGNVSIYTPEAFFLARTWQGKSMMANAGFGLILLWFFWLFDESRTKQKEHQEAYPYLLLALTNCFSGLCTSSGVLLGAGLIMLLGTALALYEKNVRVLVRSALSCVPAAAYVLLYLVLQKTVT